jgi:hypothetical protein
MTFRSEEDAMSKLTDEQIATIRDGTEARDVSDAMHDANIVSKLLQWADSIDADGDDLRPLLRRAAQSLTDRMAQIKSAVDGAAKFVDRAAALSAEVLESRAVIETLTKERDEARAYLKAFVYATIDPEDKRADAQLHKANPSIGWLFVMDDTEAGGRQILSSQVRRAMEIVGYDKLKIEAPATTVADDLVEANRAKHALAAEVLESRAEIAKMRKALSFWDEAFATGRHEPLVVAWEAARAALGGAHP